MERVEDDVAFGLENRGWPRGGDARPRAGGAREVGLGGLERRRTTTPLGRPAAAARARRRARAAARDPGPRRADGEPRPAGGRARSSPGWPRSRRRGAATIVLVEHRVDVAWPLADSSWRSTPTAGRSTSGARRGPRAIRSRAMRRQGSGCPTTTARHARPAAHAGQRPGRPSSTAQRRPLRLRRGRPVVRDIDFAPGRAERIALVGTERQRQVDARPAARRPAAPRPRGRCCSAAARRASRRPSWRAGPATSSRIRSSSSSAPRRRGGDARARRAGARAAPEALMDRLGLPLEAFGARSPYRCRAASSAGCRWRACSCAARGAGPRRADVRPGPPRPRGTARDPPRAPRATGSACSPRPTTSASSRTSPAGSSGSKAGWIVHVELAEGGLTTAEIVA